MSLRVRGLGRADRAPTPRSSPPRPRAPATPGVAVTLAAGRVTLQRVGASGNVPIASTVVDERSVHQLDVTVAGDMAAISVNGRIALRHTVRWSTRGGIGLGAWRARMASPQPVFSDLVVARA